MRRLLWNLLFVAAGAGIVAVALYVIQAPNP